MLSNGRMIVSLDFELLLGVKDKHFVNTYRKNVFGARCIIPALLDLFHRYDIHVTWATVGMLFSENKEEMIRYFPEKKPTYSNLKLSNYYYLDELANDEESDPYNYAYSIIKEILKYPHQEIGSHTFSHFYCRAEGQTYEQFAEDLSAAKAIARQKIGREIHSLSLPRDQCKQEYTKAMIELGFSSYRGCPKSILYRDGSEVSLWKRALRLLDAYLNISGMHCYKREELKENGIYNLRASRFLRPYSKTLFLFERLKISRIKAQMKHAAKNGLIFHILWHPCNFGVNSEKNLLQLEELLRYYKKLKEKFSFESRNMEEIVKELENEM